MHTKQNKQMGVKQRGVFFFLFGQWFRYLREGVGPAAEAKRT